MSYHYNALRECQPPAGRHLEYCLVIFHAKITSVWLPNLVKISQTIINMEDFQYGSFDLEVEFSLRPMKW